VPAFSNFMHFIGCVACPPFPLRLSLCRVLRVSAFPVSDLNFIGWPRSGSSLFAAILEAHPNAAVANEYDTPLVFSEYYNDAAPIVRRDAVTCSIIASSTYYTAHTYDTANASNVIR
jgi:hypothetical protein